MKPSPVDRLYDTLFAPHFVHRLEQAIILLAAGGLLIHGGLISLAHLGYMPGPLDEQLRIDPISALYTPFSFILIYEVYLFVYHLPESFTISIGKQYEIVALIIIRRIFKDIANLKLGGPWFVIDSYNFELMVDMIGILVIFALIYAFYRLSRDRPRFAESPQRTQFIRIKRFFAVALVPILLGLSMYSFGHWAWEVYHYQQGNLPELSDVNKVFYRDFFVVLIFVDVFILILSLLYSRRFSQIMRNSGFIISTVLIRVSFSADRFTNLLLLVGAIAFGVLVAWVYNWYGSAIDEDNIATFSRKDEHAEEPLVLEASKSDEI